MKINFRDLLIIFLIVSTSSVFAIPLGGNTYDHVFPGKVGIGTFTPSANLHVTGNNGVVFSGNYNQGDVLDFGAGTRLQWYSKKAAFRAGKIDGTQWDDANIGIYSFASGQDTTANARSSVVFGRNSQALNSYAMAVGYDSKALGNSSFAIGNVGIASGNKSIAMGDNVTAVGDSSLAIGYYNVASQDYTMALGTNTKTYSSYEAVLGRYNTEYTPVNATGWDASDRLFSIGNGTASGSKSNAVTVLKSGNTGIASSNPTEKLVVSGNLKIDGTNTGIVFADGTVQQTSAEVFSSWKSIAITSRTNSANILVPDNANTQAIFVKGRPLKYTVSGTDYYGMVKDKSGTTVTFIGAPMNSDPDGGVVYYGDMVRVSSIAFNIGGAFADVTDPTLLANDLGTYFKWNMGTAYLVRVSYVVKTPDTGINEPDIDITIGATDAASGLVTNASGGTWSNTEVNILTAGYQIEFDEAIEIGANANGTNNDAADLTVILTFVLE